MKLSIARWGFLTSLLFALLFTACSKDDNNGGDNGGGDNGGGGTKTSKVNISGFKFDPEKITVGKDVTVTWTNLDDAPHTVTANDNSFTSGTLNKNDTYTHTFTVTGTYDYHCEIHPMMTASVEVQ
jgi:plastocyanin